MLKTLTKETGKTSKRKIKTDTCTNIPKRMTPGTVKRCSLRGERLECSTQSDGRADQEVPNTQQTLTGFREEVAAVSDALGFVPRTFPPDGGLGPHSSRGSAPSSPAARPAERVLHIVRSGTRGGRAGPRPLSPLPSLCVPAPARVA